MNDDSNSGGAEFGSDKDGDKKRKKHVNSDRINDKQNHHDGTVPFCEEHVISELKIGGKSSMDSVWLDASIEWRPLGVIPLNRISLFAAISKYVPALIQIWRRDSLGSTLVAEKRDVSPAIVMLNGGHGGFVFFNRMTTTVRTTDKISTNGEREYVVTLKSHPELPEGSLGQLEVSAYQFFATIIENE
ncbi:hypothetical protein [Sporolactobacillus nakayamae]|uniref:Uncharacterized protein n=1 Tax=Sporolactobacillus nakayamae TaxID=269670 RepID=A0A1I2VQK3_9BACL|nr:hypothetical protein [Sporolactobacillus nakayamae]SFG91323.1 hypothetical protein SAMN02982927_03195 [Sporolactobacillus nakayamae]